MAVVYYNVYMYKQYRFRGTDIQNRHVSITNNHLLGGGSPVRNCIFLFSNNERLSFASSGENTSLLFRMLKTGFNCLIMDVSLACKKTIPREMCPSHFHIVIFLPYVQYNDRRRLCSINNRS